MEARNVTARHSLGMMIVGGLVWVFFIAYTNALAVFEVNHLVAEVSGMPLTLWVNYALNSRMNFRQPMSFKRFGVFCAVASVGWLGFFATSFVLVDLMGAPRQFSQFASIAMMTVANLLFQQVVTFRSSRADQIGYKAIADGIESEAYKG